MLRSIVSSIFVGLLATAAHAQIEFPTLDAFMQENREAFENLKKEGVFEKMRANSEPVCLERTNQKTYCACVSKVLNQQTDEYLYYDVRMTADLINAIMAAQKALKLNEFAVLQAQMTARDGLSRKTAQECGVYDEETKKVMPFVEPKAQ